MLDSSETRQQGAGKATPAAKGAKAVVESTPSHRASRGDQAIAVTEQVICGTGAVTSAGVAEGLARAGARAARLLAPSEQRAELVAGAAAPWVLHRHTSERLVGGAFGAFELVAATTQEAVDHCLVAHLTGLAGECLVERGFDERLGLYRPLEPSAVGEMLAEAESREHVPADQAGVAAELTSAFARANRGTGRGIMPVVAEGTEDADVLIVAVGEGRFAARDIAAALRAASVACGVVGIAQLRPFPTEELAPLLAGKRAILVAESGWTQTRLAAGVSAALGAAGGSKRPSVHNIDLGKDALSQAAKALGVQASATVQAARPSVVLAALPGGPRGDQLLFDVAARLVPAGSFELWHAPVAALTSVVALGAARPERAENAPIDVLFVAHPVLLDAPVFEALADGASVVVSPIGKPDAAWSELSPLQRELAAKKRLALFAFDRARSTRDEAESPAAPWLALTQALLGAAKSRLGERLALEPKALAALASEPAIVALDSKAQRAAPALAPAGDRPPRLPKAPDTVQSAAWRTALRRFHLTGEGGAGSAALLPLAPLAVSALASGTRTPGFPLFIDTDRDEVLPLASVLGETLDALEKQGQSAAVLSEHLERLVQAAAQELQSAAEPFDVVMKRALGRFAASFQQSEAAKESLAQEISAFAKALPSRGRLLGKSAHAHLVLHTVLVLAERRERTRAFCGEVERAASQLSELLRLDATRDGASSVGLGTLLGEIGSYVDSDALAKALPKKQGSRSLGEARRSRVERLLGILKGYLAEVATASELVLVHPGIVPDDLELGAVERVRHEDGFAVAAGLFDGATRRIALVFAALRAAREELAGRSDDAPLSTLDWQGFTADELRLVPPVVVLETAERIWQTSFDALSRLLRSGRPVQVLVEERTTVASTPAGLGHMLLAHLETFVSQSTLARPEQLAQSYRRMAATLRPAVTVVAPRPPVGPMPAWLELAAAHEGRGSPCFRYDPDAGSSFAECFEIAENPQNERAWPSHALEIEGADGQRRAMSLGFTFADAVALGVGFRQHFWVIPPEAWSDDQLELERYVDALATGLPRELPFVWVVSEDGVLARAIVSRRLAFETRERLRLWRVAQELGGSANEHARRAAEQARAAAVAEAAAEKQALEAAHAAEIERIKSEEAAEALSRLAKVLMDPNAIMGATSALSVPVARQAAPSAPAEAPAEAAPTAAPAPAVEEEAVSFSDPFIDTPLCTTCNECTNLNPLMFKYNADKQAVLADVKAGTFLQLVQAAEKCPAACIHPGAPRKDDATATEEVIARAAKFN